MDSVRRFENGRPVLLIVALCLLIWMAIQGAAASGRSSRPRQAGLGQRLLGVLLPALMAKIALLVDAVAEHAGLHPVRPSQRDQALGQALGLPTTMTSSRCSPSCDLGDQCLRRGDLGPGRADRQVRQPGRSSLRAVHARSGHAVSQRGGQRGQPVLRLLQPLAAADLLPHRRPDHRRGRHPDPAVEAVRRPVRLHLHVARRLRRRRRRDRRRPHRRLLVDPPDQLELADLYQPNGVYWYAGGWNWRAVVALLVGAVLAVGGACSAPGQGPFPADGIIPFL